MSHCKIEKGERNLSLPPKNFYEFKNSKIASRGMRITLPQRIHLQLHVSTGDALSSDQTEIIGDIEQGMVLDVSLDGKRNGNSPL